MTEITEKSLSEEGWYNLQMNWIKNGETVYPHNGSWKFKGKQVKYMEQLVNPSINERRYRHTFGELCDRLFICQLKELLIPEKRGIYTQQINDIVHDLDLLCKEKNLGIGGKLILALGNNMLMNRLIWENESNQRKGIDSGNDLKFTHSINTLRTQSYSLISEITGDHGEYKKDTLYPDGQWVPSLLAETKPNT